MVPDAATTFPRASAAMGAAFALALAAAVSLGLSRFSYALLLPPMRADLGWSYLSAGAMNTANALGYLIGALLAPRWLARRDARQVLIAGGAAAAGLLALHALITGRETLLLLRAATGVASAASFVAGGLLAARLASRVASPGRVLGLYYGGTGLGIVAAALGVPPLADLPPGPHWPTAHPWQAAWLALGALALLATVFTARGTRGLAAPPGAAAQRLPFRWAPMAPALAGYLMFGLGYIGYMTFVITLLREQGLAPGLIVAFYVLLGAGVVASSWIWAGLLQRARGGGALALLNGLLALATVLPVLGAHPLVVFASGALFGGVFLALVASTTALVRHNLPPAAWPGGISAFTIVFAAGQIVGPSLVGWVADGAGGLERGFAVSAAVLALGAVLAWRQRPLVLPAAAAQLTR